MRPAKSSSGAMPESMIATPTPLVEVPTDTLDASPSV